MKMHSEIQYITRVFYLPRPLIFRPTLQQN